MLNSISKFQVLLTSTQIKYPVLQWLLVCGAAIPGNVRKLLLAIILLDIPFQLDIHLGYREEYTEFGALGGWCISATTIALLGLYIIWLVEILTKKSKTETHPLFRRSLPLSAYVGFVFLSVVVAHNMQLALFQNFLLLQMFMLFLYIIGTVRSRKDVLFIVTVLLIGLVIESTINIWLYYVGHTIKFAGLTARVIGGYRIGGTLGHANTAGGYLSLLLVPALSIILADKKKFYKWLGIFAFCLGTVAIILTFSRGGWLAFAVSSTIFIFISWSRGWLPLWIPIMIVIVVMFSAIFFHEAPTDMILPIDRISPTDRIFGDDNGAAWSRIPLMKLAFHIIVANPLLGVGANNFTVIMKDYVTSDLRGMWLYAVHNKYLLVWAETGTGGLLAFLWFLGSSIRSSWRCWQTRDPFLAPVGLALTCAIIGHMVHMNVDTFQGRPLIQMLWVCCALSLAMSNILKSERSEFEGRDQT